MKQVIICIGLPGSGKTTFSKEWMNQHPEYRLRFNNDDIYKNMYFGKYDPSVYIIIREMLCTFLENSISSGYDVVLDNTHLNPRVLLNTVEVTDQIINKYHPGEYEIIIKDFTNVNLDICLERNSKRANPVIFSHIEKMNEKIQDVKDLIFRLKFPSPDSPVVLNTQIKIENL